MRCTYNDGTKISYTGPFQITRGNDLNVFIKDGAIPDDLKVDLEEALYRNSCTYMRAIGEKVTKIYGAKACVH
jgi:hypothetical protein